MSLLTTDYYSSNGTEIMGMAPSSSANTRLKWETTYQYDLGLDVSLFKNRLDFVIDLYYKDTRDMLYRATLPAQTGFNQQWQNLGRVENKGVEMSLMSRLAASPGQPTSPSIFPGTGCSTSAESNTPA